MKMLADAKAKEEKDCSPEEEAHAKAQKAVSYPSPPLLSPLNHSLNHIFSLQVERACKILEYSRIGPTGGIKDDDVRQKVEVLIKELNTTDILLEKLFTV